MTLRSLTANLESPDGTPFDGTVRLRALGVRPSNPTLVTPAVVLFQCADGALPDGAAIWSPGRYRVELYDRLGARLGQPFDADVAEGEGAVSLNALYRQSVGADPILSLHPLYDGDDILRLGSGSEPAGRVLTTATDGTLAWGDAGAGDMLKATYDTNDNGIVDHAALADAAPWSGITGKPATFPPATHMHTAGEVEGIGDLGDLTTAVTDTLVAAINEVKATVDAGTGSADPVVLDYRKDFHASTSTVTTTGTIAEGSTGLLVGDVTSYAAGQGVCIGSWCTSIISVAAPVITLADPAPADLTGATVRHDNTSCLRAVRDRHLEEPNMALYIPFGPGGMSDCIYEHRGADEGVEGFAGVVAWSPRPALNDGVGQPAATRYHLTIYGPVAPRPVQGYSDPQTEGCIVLRYYAEGIPLISFGDRAPNADYGDMGAIELSLHRLLLRAPAGGLAPMIRASNIIGCNGSDVHIDTGERIYPTATQPADGVAALELPIDGNFGFLTWRRLSVVGFDAVMIAGEHTDVDYIVAESCRAVLMPVFGYHAIRIGHVNRWQTPTLIDARYIAEGREATVVIDIDDTEVRVDGMGGASGARWNDRGVDVIDPGNQLNVAIGGFTRTISGYGNIADLSQDTYAIDGGARVLVVRNSRDPKHAPVIISPGGDDGGAPDGATYYATFSGSGVDLEDYTPEIGSVLTQQAGSMSVASGACVPLSAGAPNEYVNSTDGAADGTLTFTLDQLAGANGGAMIRQSDASNFIFPWVDSAGGGVLQILKKQGGSVGYLIDAGTSEAAFAFDDGDTITVTVEMAGDTITVAATDGTVTATLTNTTAFNQTATGFGPRFYGVGAVITEMAFVPAGG